MATITLAFVRTVALPMHFFLWYPLLLFNSITSLYATFIDTWSD